jgi:hypothetical protein
MRKNGKNTTIDKRKRLECVAYNEVKIKRRRKVKSKE